MKFKEIQFLNIAWQISFLGSVAFQSILLAILFILSIGLTIIKTVNDGEI